MKLYVTPSQVINIDGKDYPVIKTGVIDINFNGCVEEGN